MARLTGLAAETAQSLVVVGPTQSGKTTSLAVPAILGWSGPVVAASVKSDLLRHTLGTRAHLGQVWCIDPTGSTGARASTWSPLTGCGQWREACRASAELCEAAKGEGTTADGEFWYATAGKLLAPLFVAAALDGRTMADVVRWVDTQEVGEVAAILERAAPPEVLHAAEATWCRDDRTRSSIYTTAETVLAPFAHPPPGPPADGTFEPGALLGGAHTLYLCAPAHDQRRLRGYFTALTQAVLAHAFATATKSGRPLDPPLLVVLDEAAHIAPLPELDGLAATCASHGIQIVTVWQDLAQVRARYGARAPTVLNNHRAKLFLPGIADPDTLEYASRLIGDEEASHPSVTRDPTGAALDDVVDGAAPAAAARGPPLPAAGSRRARLRIAAAGAVAAAALVGARAAGACAGRPRRPDDGDEPAGSSLCHSGHRFVVSPRGFQRKGRSHDQPSRCRRSAHAH